MKKHLRKFLAILLILSLAGVCGCETLKNAFCSPTAEQIMSAAERLDQASDTLYYLEGQDPTPAITATIAALKIAIPILRRIKDGVCVTAEEEANASRAAQASYTVAVTMGYGAK
jgi:hypothetical protein